MDDRRTCTPLLTLEGKSLNATGDLSNEPPIPFDILTEEDTIKKDDVSPNGSRKTKASIYAPGEDSNYRHPLLGQKIPTLPDGKDKYFFVSHSSEDSIQVLMCVEILETRFDLPCFYADRDFQPGKDISENIREGMNRSLKVLLFLSPRFQDSGWCKFERDFAFMLSIENGSSCVIPVVLEECELPTTLKTLTYIDATSPEVDVPLKIVEALLDTNEADGFLPLDVIDLQEIYENGYSFSITGKKEETFCSLTPAKYQFHVNQTLHMTLRDHKVEIPAENLTEETIAMVNKAKWMNWYDYLKRKIFAILCCLSIPFHVFIYLFICKTEDLANASRTHFSYDYLDRSDSRLAVFLFVLMFILPLILVSIVTIEMIWRRQRGDIVLQGEMWQQFGDQFYASNCLILFSDKNKLPMLYFMRYRFDKCENYLANAIKEKNPKMNFEDCKDIARLKMKLFIKGIQSTLVDDFDTLPDAPYNRHHVKKKKNAFVKFLSPFFSTILKTRSERFCNVSSYVQTMIR